MSDAIKNAKAVLERLNIRAVSSRNAAEDLIRDAERALAAMIEENERLTAPLDADEGRELVAILREADRGRVDAEVRARLLWIANHADQPIDRIIGQVSEMLLVLDTAKPAKPDPDLAKLRRDVGAMKLPAAVARNRTLDEVLALIDQQEAGE